MVRSAIMASAISTIALLSTATPAIAQRPAAQNPSIDIAAQPLSTALTLFGDQTGIQVTGDTAILDGKRSQPVRGRYAPAEALSRLLSGTGISFRWLDARSIMLERAPQTSGSEILLGPVVVEANSGSANGAGGSVETATGPVAGFIAHSSATATKTDTPLIETPRSISVITRDRMDAQQIQTVEQALRYTAGTLTEVTGFDLRYQSVTIRGFFPANFRDGLRVYVSGSYSDWTVEPTGLERVEVLKGAASVLYGQAAPGGIINMVTKRPSLDAPRSVQFLAGNHDRFQGSMDVGGKLDDDGHLLFRLNAMVRNSGTQTDHVQDDRIYVAPALSWQPDDATTLTVMADYTHDRMTPKSWWPDQSLITANPNGPIPTSAFAGEPGFDHYNRDAWSVTGIMEHRFNEHWTVRENVRFSRFKLDNQHIYSNDFEDDLRHVTRGTLVSRTSGNSVASDTQSEWNFSTGPVQHRLLVGFDYQWFSGRELLGFGDAPDLDVYAPVYNSAAVPPTDVFPNTQKMNLYGLYAQDQVMIDRLILNLGVRHDWARTDTWSDPNRIVQNDRKATYNVGILYKTALGLAPFASYATSFEPTVELAADGAILKPMTGRQFEVGLKYQPASANSFVSLALFDLRKQNVTTADPDNPGFNIQTGEIAAQGVELEGTLTINPALSLFGSYTYLDAKVTRSNNPVELGHQPRQTARNMANLWADYKLPVAVLEGLSIGAGVRYVDRVPSNAANTLYNRPYTLVDAAIRYTRGPIRLAVNASNLFDRIYTANFANFYGQRRVVQATVGYSW